MAGKKIWFVGLLVSVCFCLFSGVVSAPAQELQAPHHGALVKMGKEYAYTEFILDPTKGELTLYVLDADAAKPVRLAQEAVRVSGTADGHPFTVKMNAVANPENGEKKWDSSVFRGDSKDLEGVQQLDASIFFIRISGTNFSKVRFKYQAVESKTEKSIAK